MKTRNILELIGNGSMYVLTATQTKEIFEIISLILSIAISLLILVGHIVAWAKRAGADGKIDADEVNELVDTTKGDFEKLKEEADEIVAIVQEEHKED